jgi:ferritin-like metal-binding protein YciE
MTSQEIFATYIQDAEAAERNLEDALRRLEKPANKER